MQHGYKVNLDLLRAAAIAVVVVFHISQYTSIPGSWQSFFALGTFGVDLFFVLSGWLIGGIFFREYQQLGRVSLSRFWGRRWLRTMPPYYVALLISWLAVFVSRHQAFDFRFLVFGQNYSSIPAFFMVSWSLCIEEHFYLVLPLALYAGLKTDSVVAICLSVILASVLARVSNHVGSFPAFGYSLTATHFRLDGLSLGVLCAHMHLGACARWQRFASFMKPAGVVCGTTGVALYFLDGPLMYNFGILFISIGFAGLLCYAVDAAAWRVSSTRIVSLIAGASYSIYLTHALAIHFTRQFVAEEGFFFVIGAVVSTLIAGSIFFVGVEGSSKKVRDHLFPALVTPPARSRVATVTDRRGRLLPGILRTVYRRTLGVSSPDQLGYAAEQTDMRNPTD